MNRLLKYLGITAGVVVLAVAGMVADVQLRYADRIHEVSTATEKPVAIVLGAAVTRAGEPSDALRDRILTAVDLYKAGKVQSLFMTGDNGAFHIDEISVMAKTAREAGVPEEAIRTDGQGYRTYESCKRAVQEFGITSALVVTQRFHLGRALYLCNGLGMNADGVSADRQTYVRIKYFWIRDLAASLKAFWDVHISSPSSPLRT